MSLFLSMPMSSLSRVGRVLSRFSKLPLWFSTVCLVMSKSFLMDCMLLMMVSLRLASCLSIKAMLGCPGPKAMPCLVFSSSRVLNLPSKAVRVRLVKAKLVGTNSKFSRLSFRNTSIDPRISNCTSTSSMLLL